MKQAREFAVQPSWRLLLCDMGFNPDRLLRSAQLPPDLFSRSGASITADQYFRLWQAMEDATGAESLPLLLGQSVSSEAFDPPIFASLCSPNLTIAMQRMALYKRLIGPITLTVNAQASGCSITLACYGNQSAIPKSLAMSELVFLTQLIRLGTRHRMVPVAVTLPDPPDDLAGYAAYFGVTPQRKAQISLVFSRDDSIRPFLTANDAMWAYFEPGLGKRLSSLESTATMSDRVQAALMEGLPAGQHSIESVCKALALSTRTLQRQLRDEATSFSEILNATRRQLAQHYLSSSDISLGEIAFLLGFQEVNSFIRAFKDWSGMTPSTYRQEIAPKR